MQRRSLLAVVLTGLLVFAGALTASAATPAAAASPTPDGGYYGTLTFDKPAPGKSGKPSVLDNVEYCPGSPLGKWINTRESSCWRAGLTYRAYDAKTHAVVGQADLVITQSISLHGDSTDMDEGQSIEFLDGSGVAASGLTVSWTSGCDSGCKVTQPSTIPNNAPITIGNGVDGKVGYANPQQPGGVDQYQLSYLLQINSPGSLGDAPAAWAGPIMRCDDQFAGRKPGCVVTDYTPIFTVDSTKKPLAAAGVRWAQDNLAAHPGKAGVKQPLHRLKDKAKQDANRRKICRTGWTPSPDVSNDSCDEYPFAATQEGGSMSGPDCAEIIPHSDGTVQVLKPASDGATCVRAHVPRSQNTEVGGDLGRFAAAQRVTDGEPYWVSA